MCAHTSQYGKLNRIDLFFHVSIFGFSPFFKFRFLFVLLDFPHFSSLPSTICKNIWHLYNCRCNEMLRLPIKWSFLWMILMIYWKISPMSHVHTLPTIFEMHWICVLSTYRSCTKTFSHATSHISISRKVTDYPHQYSLHIKEWPWMSIICPFPLIPC